MVTSPRLARLFRLDAIVVDLAIVTVVTILLTQATARSGEPDTPSSAWPQIQESALVRHINTLASDTLRGRAAGSEGGHAAGAYLVKSLRECNLQPGGKDGDFYQEFSDRGFRNVLAVLPGSDPALKHRFVVLGAHYDHVGLGTKRTSLGGLGQIHNGADDNASGTAAVLEVARVLATSPSRTRRRSILFVFWDAEELGLLGSKHWVQAPTTPIDSIDLAINADMLGRLRSNRLVVFGSRTGAGLRQLIATPNSRLATPLTLAFNWNLIANSDHHPFFANNVPVLFLHTGLHDNYHRPSDDAVLIHWKGLTRISRLLAELTLDAANRSSLPAHRAAAGHESEEHRQRLESAALTAQQRLGATWDPDMAQRGVIQLTHIFDDTAADEADLKKGDRLLELGNARIRSVQQLTRQLLTASSPLAVIAQRPRKKKLRRESLLLPGRPRKLGFDWYTDVAEPGCVIVRGVVPGTPAAAAGLADADRIISVNGQPIERPAVFSDLLDRQAGKLSLLVEHQGHLKTLIVTRSTPPGDSGHAR